MATIAENLQTIIDIKADIKTAIENKGVEVGDASFGSYAEKINEIANGIGIMDFSEINYTEGSMPKMYNDLMYSKSLYDAWDPATTTAHYLYQNDTTLVYAPNIDTKNVISVASIFSGCENLKYVPPLDLSGLTYIANESIFTASHMFYRCESLESLPLLDLGKANDIDWSFRFCYELKNIEGFTDLGKSYRSDDAESYHRLNFSESLKLTKRSCLNIFNTVYDMNLNNNIYAAIGFSPNVYDQLSDDDIAIATTKGWEVRSILSSHYTEVFEHITNGAKLDATGMKFGYSTFSEVPSYLDFSRATDLSKLFYECPYLINADIGKITSATELDYMVYYCSNLKSINMSDTSNVTSAYNAFYQSNRLTAIPQIDTSNIVNASQMIYRCTGLTDVPELNLGKADDCDGLLFRCTALRNIGGFVDLGKGFLGSTSIQNLDISGSSFLSYDSCMNIINKVYDMNLNTLFTKTASITFHATPYASLSADDIAIATNKGWTVQSA